MVVEPAASIGVALRIVLGVVAGVVATLGMDVAMARLPEGETPPTVAAGVLTEQAPDTAPGRLASAVHYVAGGATGPLFVTLLFLVEGLLGGVSAASYLLTTLLLFGLMVAFFVGVVLPRPGLARQRVSAIGRDWALSAAAYLLVLVPLVWIGSAAL
ncbi:hypothetical protein [Haloarcula halophila]|uniref:hypothetical protein n=1 Tax=Haloarcula TaxID=2237 RepID=UPI0023E44B83|nr:hypothetical protein [Halomicroarcula sp. DFY41]